MNTRSELGNRRRVPWRTRTAVGCCLVSFALADLLRAAEPGVPAAAPAAGTSDAPRIAGMRLTGGAGKPDTDLVPLPPAEFMPDAGGAPAAADEWLIAPIPGYSPTFGATLAVGVAKLYRPAGREQEPRPWTTGGGAFAAENKSWGLAFGHKMGLGLDTWRLSGGALYGDLIYDFYGIGNEAGKNDRSVSLHHQAAAAMVSALRKVGSRWFVGANLAAIDSRIQVADNATPPPEVELPPELAAPNATFAPLLVSIAPRVQYDSRNSEYYPTSGILFDAKISVCSESFGSDFDFWTYVVSYNQYFAWSANDVIAIRFHGRLAEGDVPFFAMSSLGQGSDLRGYTPGRYRDNALLTLQGEYRRRISKRWYAVAFGGVGGVGPTLRDLGQALPAGGVGVRYVLAEENHIAMRLDAAWGRDDSAFYLSVGEAF